MLDSEFQILDSGFQIPDSGCRILDSRFRLLAYAYNPSRACLGTANRKLKGEQTKSKPEPEAVTWKAESGLQRDNRTMARLEPETKN